jgi:hypothetical protein
MKALRESGNSALYTAVLRGHEPILASASAWRTPRRRLWPSDNAPCWNGSWSGSPPA